jgi:hypothetical protein
MGAGCKAPSSPNPSFALSVTSPEVDLVLMTVFGDVRFDGSSLARPEGAGGPLSPLFVEPVAQPSQEVVLVLVTTSPDVRHFGFSLVRTDVADGPFLLLPNV